MQQTTLSREVERLVEGMAASDGAGVRLKRVLGGELQRRLDPFLMLDEFGTDDPADYIAGFPDHPHRGFETVTYMLAGRMRHRDNVGNEGLLTPGAVQWMTAGRGIVHSEMPEQIEGRMQGFQLWVNLPAARKMIPAAYRDIAPECVPEIKPQPGVALKIISGEVDGHRGAVEGNATDVLFLDIVLEAGATYAAAISGGHNAFVYVYAGEAGIGGRGQAVGAGTMAVLSNAPGATGATLESAAGARMILLAGRPLNEAIAQWGPFVMNSREEIEQAIDDYRNGRF
ncbi:pirin family protein [Paludibacterium yongneupense]|uniref:pirin family protein n=1 Tax=Paludibacterium yongneupense TaxID=400061 RepID=UPI000412F5EC|nr:pirin family protein [Paludibacterium yongneupense]